MENELILFQASNNNIYCSKLANTENEKKALFNALESCDALLNDCVGTEIMMQDIYCEVKEAMDESTGEMRTKYRTIIFDANGQTYATTSYGIYNVLRKIIAIYGEPTWTEPIKVKVAKRSIGNGKSTLTLTLV